MGGSTAELFVSHVFACHGFDHIWSCDVHLPDSLYHEDEVCHGGRIDCAPGARAGDNGDLRNYTGSEGVAAEDLTVSCERVDALLNPRASGVVDAYYGSTDACCVVHDFCDFLGSNLRQRTA